MPDSPASRASDAPRFIVFLNRDAGTGRADRRLARALRRVPEFARRAEVVPCADAAELAARVAALEDADVPVAAGGDGTLNQVATALHRAGRLHRPLGVLPLGTGNAIAHAHGMPTPERAAAALARGHVRSVDVLMTDREDVPLALGSISAGGEAAFLAIASRRRGWHRWPGAFAALPSLMRHARTRLRVTVDGVALPECAEPLANAGVYNMPCYGFGWRFWPGAAMDDGVAEVVTWRGALDYVTLALSAGAWRRPGVHLRKARVVRLETDGGFQLDGEHVPGPSICARLVPGALRLVAG